MSDQTLAAGMAQAPGPVAETFATPDDFGELRASDLHSSLSEELAAEGGDALGSGMRSLWRATGYLAAQHGWTPILSESDPRLRQPWGPDEPVPSQQQIPIDDAKARIKQEGLERQVALPDQPTIGSGVLAMMIRDGHDRAQTAAAIARGPHNFATGALGLATEIGAGMIDPVNAAAFSIPVLGEARYGQLLASAGESVLKRTALRTGIGAAQGAVGGAAMLPLDWWLHTQDGSDFTYADALKSVVMSAGMGAAFHGGGGLLGDLNAMRKGAPLPGSLADLRLRAASGDTHAAAIVEKLGGAGTHLPEEALSPAGVDVDEIPGISAPARPLAPQAPEVSGVSSGPVPQHPAEVLADLPPEAQQDVVHAAAAGIINGEPVRVAEVLQQAAKEDPRIAETVDPYFEAYHGSPHDFDAFTHKNGKEVGLDEVKRGAPVDNNPPLRTGRPAVDAVLAQPQIRDAIANPKIDREHDVPYEAGASEGNDPTTHVDQRLPRQVTISGKTFDPAIPANIHEQVEKFAMERLIAKFRAREGREPNEKEMDAIYVTAHHEFAEPAEDAWYRANGIDVDEVNKWWASQDKITEHENPKNPPPTLYKKPYPHNKVEGARREEEGVAEEWPTTVDVVGAGEDQPARLPGKVVDLKVNPRPPRGPRARPEETWSLLEFLASRGGIDPNDPLISDLRGSIGRSNKFIPGFGHLIRKGGMRLDRAREAAVEAGYIPDEGMRMHGAGESTSTPTALLEAMDRELRGQRVYREGNEGTRTAAEGERAEDEYRFRRDEAEGRLDDALRQVEIDPKTVAGTLRERTVEIMLREGVEDPVDAYERAVMEGDHNAAETGSVEPSAEKIPGWDADVGGPAPGEGERAAIAGNAEGARAGGASRQPGETDRQPRQRADWQQLARRDDPDGAELAAASRQADKAPAPPDNSPEASSAAQAAATKADELLADMLPTLSEDERKTFEQALADLEDNEAAREQIVREGAACLAEAVA